ncbi:MAG: phenylalanine--tRNA ligase subunit alpha [Firmicutes bacterium]|nr:phenylalanine--tRNA ligase subunit alpha [Bacillota bacterium]
MKEKLMQLMQEAESKMASISSLQEAEELRVRLLGKKGELTEMLKGMKALAPEDRKTFGQAANEARAKIENTLNERMEYFRNAQKELALAAERVDVTEPAVHRELGSRHLLSVTIDEITSCFRSMGFSVVEGPEVETVFNNFDALNAGPNHPARDITDTFYITDDVLLRTQTSPVQVRTLLSQKPPIKVIAPGRCFRCDTPDATHSPMFHQVEGLVVDEGITMADLKGVLDQFAKQMFGSSTRTKFRPHHFPFTEPSAEMDVSCFKCGGKGCKVCKGSGWIEILGCGMVHPNVLKVGGIDTEKYTGFAFGMGVERTAMLKYEVDDIRLLYENDIRFVKQFR